MVYECLEIYPGLHLVGGRCSGEGKDISWVVGGKLWEELFTSALVVVAGQNNLESWQGFSAALTAASAWLSHSCGSCIGLLVLFVKAPGHAFGTKTEWGCKINQQRERRPQPPSPETEQLSVVFSQHIHQVILSPPSFICPLVLAWELFSFYICFQTVRCLCNNKKLAWSLWRLPTAVWLCRMSSPGSKDCTFPAVPPWQSQVLGSVRSQRSFSDCISSCSEWQVRLEKLGVVLDSHLSLDIDPLRPLDFSPEYLFFLSLDLSGFVWTHALVSPGSLLPFPLPPIWLSQPPAALPQCLGDHFLFHLCLWLTSPG